MSDLSKFSTDDLARELANRPDLLKPDGSLRPDVYALGNLMKPNVTADSIAVRRKENDGGYEAGMIRRANHQDIGKLVVIGGNVYPGETRLMAVARHWMTDLGHEVRVLPQWKRYPLESCYGLPDEQGGVRSGFDGIDGQKYSMSVTYLVELVEPSRPFTFGHGPGGREAGVFEWITADTPDEEFGYGMGPIVKECLRRHRELCP